MLRPRRAEAYARRSDSAAVLSGQVVPATPEARPV